MKYVFHNKYAVYKCSKDPRSDETMNKINEEKKEYLYDVWRKYSILKWIKNEDYDEDNECI